VAGSRVRVRVAVGDPYSALVVPDTAILSDQERRYLLVVNADNVVSRYDIQPGRLLDDGFRIVRPASGNAQPLGNEDRIITLGLQRARVNYPVEPIEALRAEANPAARESPTQDTSPSAATKAAR
jgi:multidrug efflux pump subunit AcrA (membrane-fusion protein)